MPKDSSKPLPVEHRFIDEIGDTTFYLIDRNPLVVDLYDSENYSDNRNHYHHRTRPLTAQPRFQPRISTPPVFRIAATI